MSALEAVDAKVERARSELRLLKADISSFCEERARLIVREEDGKQERWVYRGDTSKAPVQWSIRAGEFAYNLRSALDHLVWQLVLANGKQPDGCNNFPIQHKYHAGNFRKDLRGVSQVARDYIKSVQPYQVTELDYPPDFYRVGKGLAMLNEICNRDKHRHLAIANVRWTGGWLKVRPMFTGSGPAYLDPKDADEIVGCELENDHTLVVTSGYRDWHYLEFPVNAFIDKLPYSDIGAPVSVSETLDACIDSVEMVVAHFRETFR